jgi:dipeptidyl aminopeptidase/acylaminoacyl peptidase
MAPRLKSFALLVTFVALTFGSALAQYGQQTGTQHRPPMVPPPRPVQPAVAPLAPSQYKTPPQAIVDLVDAKPIPRTSISPDNKWVLLLDFPPLVPLSEISARELRLAGLRIRPATNGPSRGGYYTQITLQNLADSTKRVVTGIPKGTKIATVSWAPDASKFAFTVTDDKNVELWMTDVAKLVTRRVIRQRLNAALGTPYRWGPNSKGFVVSVVPEDRGPEPPEPPVPIGPVTQENLGKAAPARTYQDLLTNLYDESLFEYYGTSQLMLVDLGGDHSRLGTPGLYTSFEPSPDAKYILVTSVHKPFSYLVPGDRFPHKIEVWDRDGKVVRTLADVPLQEGVPITFNSVPTGPREVDWRSDAPATLFWVEAQDGGDAKAEAAIRDKLFVLDAPFKGQPQTLASLSERFSNVFWGRNDLAIVKESWWKTRNEKTWIVNPASPGAEPAKLYDRSMEDRYNDPGSFVMTRNRSGDYVLLTSTDGKNLYLLGQGFSPEGKKPFLDKLDIATQKADRLWRSEAPYYEVPLGLLDADAKKLLTRRESKTDPPNYYVRTLDPKGANDLRALTAYPNPYPSIKDVSKELIHYKRADGVDLTGTLYLPAGYKKEDGPLPLVMWAYPQEFKDADMAGQVTDSPYQFDVVSWSSPLVWLTQGYAVFDDPKLPIVGEGDVEPNDTYVQQLQAGAQAAVDAVVAKGVADRNRIAVGGHSYGAFMTANLLAHTDLFRAGIARSGAYNRTLTPFGFQSEERTFWQAPEVYNTMSPFNHADKINEPLLLIHGEADNNPGTFPIQSERFYNALKGLGATVRLVMLPEESHSYRARESVLHMLYESDRWLDTYVKNAKPRETLSGQSTLEKGK